MKTTAQVIQDRQSASPAELACATIDMMAMTIRSAIEDNNAAQLTQALSCLAGTVAMMQQWLTEASPKA